MKVGRGLMVVNVSARVVSGYRRCFMEMVSPELGGVRMPPSPLLTDSARIRFQENPQDVEIKCWYPKDIVMTIHSLAF